MKSKLLLVLAVGSIVALAGCSNDQITDKDLSSSLIEMTKYEGEVKDVPADEFCTSLIKQYGDYGVVVSERADIKNRQASEDVSKEEVTENLVGQQRVVQGMENLVGGSEVKGNEQVSGTAEVFRPASISLISAFNDARSSGNMEKIDVVISNWEQKAQPMVISCIEYKDQQEDKATSTESSSSTSTP